jgi:anti-anti-sigma factor
MNNSSDSDPGEASSSRIRIDRVENAIVIVPNGDLGEFVVTEVAAEAEATVRRLQESTDCCHAVVDFRNTDYFGSSALGLFLRLWKRVRERGGRMAMCNLSEHENELLRVTRLDEFWIIRDSLESALAAVHDRSND